MESPEVLLHGKRSPSVSPQSDSDGFANASAVARLPHDALVIVFSSLVAEELRDGRDVPVMDHIPSSVPWVRLAYVCRRWRHAALNSAALWRYLVLPLPERWAHEMPARAQQAPIFLSFYPMPEEKEATTWLPVATLERVQEVDLTHFNGSETDLVQLLSTPAPLLEVAQLVIEDADPLELGAPLFGDTAPRLRKLTSHAFSWTAPPISNLVELQLMSAVDTPSTMPDFVAALRQLPLIEVLVLADGCLPPCSSPSQPSDSSIARVPSLRCLSISGTPAQCVNALRHVQGQTAVKLQVASSTDGRASEFAALYPFLAPTVGGHAEQPYPVVRLQPMGPYSLSLKASHAEHGPPNRAFDFEWMHPDDTAIDLMHACFAEICVRHVASLSIQLPVDYPLDDDGIKRFSTELLHTWRDATELQRLEATGSTGTALCLALSVSMEDGSGTIVWPRLRDLLLHQMYLPWNSEGENDVDVGDEGDGMRSGKVLLEALERRHQSGVALDTLHLLSCSVESPWLREVEDVVRHMVVEDVDE
ncbi:hypothetical protein FA95DRAFT_1565543 [Auriscalpium vulgare]|uniref:Uncharacterized protein n=1 Tax=Auriscalpium vulgare TaxID=40419 RepID=A0ACB8RBN1_9AGAM|nr:hypothetical protein FA95DRAFT_1565543 [Auriscalpium vulgare]